MRKHNFRRYVTASCLSVLLAACGGGSQDSAAPVANRQAQIMGGAQAQTSAESLAADEPVHLLFSVKLNDQAGLDQYFKEMHDPASANYQKTLTPAEIQQRFGPTQAQIDKVTAFLKAQGFTNLVVAKNNLLIEADAPSQLAQATFKTTLKKYTLSNGAMAHANTSAPTLPAEIADTVRAVYGLDTVTQFRTHHIATLASPSLTKPAAQSTVAALTVHQSTEFPGIYNVGSTSTASGKTVGIIAWGDVTPTIADLRVFEQQNGLPTTATRVVTVGTASSDTSAQVEWSLDSQAIVGMSGGVGQLNFYVADSANFTHVLQAINAAIQENTAQVVNMSFGICDTGSGTSFDNTYFEVAAVQGQTFVASTGDDGSNPPACGSGAAVQYPSSSQFVVAVGGTTLQTNGSSYASETAWSGSGGGISQYVTIPFWQANVAALAGKTKRSAPDVAYDAAPESGMKVYKDGSLYNVGGTSLSAPLFTATWARLLNSCGNLGFAAPSLYAYANSNPNMYYDVTSGSNGAYSAGAGWDAVTGWGSINISNMRTVLCPGAAYTSLTQALYLAYLGRPAEPGRLAYWGAALKSASAPTTLSGLSNAYNSNASVASIVNSFASSAESQGLYTSSNLTIYITQVYGKLFNRVPDSAGLVFWGNAVNTGGLSKSALPLAVLASGVGTYSSDAVIAGNKIGVATNFSATLTPSQSSFYAGATAIGSARHLLQNVASNGVYPVDDGHYYVQHQYVSIYQSNVNAAIAAIVAGTPY